MITTHTLYTPAPAQERTPGAVKKTQLFTDRVKGIEAQIADDERWIAEHEGQHAPEVLRTAKEVEEARQHHAAAVRNRDELQALVNASKLNIQRLEEEIAATRVRIRDTEALIAAHAPVIAGMVEDVSLRVKIAAEAVERRDNQTWDKTRHVAKLNDDLRKARYRLAQHLARNPKATLEEPSMVQPQANSDAQGGPTGGELREDEIAHCMTCEEYVDVYGCEPGTCRKPVAATPPDPEREGERTRP